MKFVIIINKSILREAIGHCGKIIVSSSFATDKSCITSEKYSLHPTFVKSNFATIIPSESNNSFELLVIISTADDTSDLSILILLSVTKRNP